MDTNLEWVGNFRWWILQEWIKVRLMVTTYKELHEVNMNQECKNSIAQVYEIGENFNDQKTGTWKYIYNNNYMQHCY